MARVGVVGVDSTKLAANASTAQNRTCDGLRGEAERIIEEAIATDQREDQLDGDRRGDELPEELADRRTRQAKIKELSEQGRQEREQAEAERDEWLAEHAEHLAQTGKRKHGRPPKPVPNRDQQRLVAKKYNVTEPDSGVVGHRGMLLHGYNVQASASEDQVILATGVSGSHLTAVSFPGRDRPARRLSAPTSSAPAPARQRVKGRPRGPRKPEARRAAADATARADVPWSRRISRRRSR
jgi:hypothetical protein